MSTPSYTEWANRPLLAEPLEVHQIVTDPLDGLEYQVLFIGEPTWPGGPRCVTMTRGDGSSTLTGEGRYCDPSLFAPKPEPMAWVRDDGGRAASGRFTADTAPGDCVVRAFAIATGLPYLAVYDRVNALAKLERPRRGSRTRSQARDGVRKPTIQRLGAELPGWAFVPQMKVGQGCRVHLRADELPAEGRYVLSLSKHYAALVDGVVRDLYLDDRYGTRCVYGWWTGPLLEAVPEAWS